MTTIKENNLATLATYAYDTAGRRMSVTLGNGNITSYSYYGDDALNTLSHNVGGAADDVNWTYGFNKVNQLTSKVISNALYQWHPLYTKNDAYTSNGLNQYSAVANSTLTYDANGNLTGDNVWLYIYDTENMLLGASRSGTSASYIYDPLGRRSAKSVDGVLTTFLNDGVEEIADYNSAGTLLRRYVHGPGVDEYLVMYTGTGTTSKSYFHANHQGSIVAMSDAAGTVTEQHSYDSYGNSDDLTGNPFRYTGRRLDAETGLYYYRARYYSPAIGRFLQTDPIGYGDGLNWYAYVGNDPVNGTDPRGLGSCPTVSSNCIGKPKKRRTTASSEDEVNHSDFSGLIPSGSVETQLNDKILGSLESLGDPKLDRALTVGINLVSNTMRMFNENNDQYANTNIGVIIKYNYEIGHPSKHILSGQTLATGYQGRVALPSNMRAVVIGISLGAPKDFLRPEQMKEYTDFSNSYNVPLAVFFRDSGRYPGTVIILPYAEPVMLK